MRGIDQHPERAFARGELSPIENAIDFIPTKKPRGDRRVRSDSEEAAILARRHRGEQLALARGERAGRTHHRLRELQEMLRSLWIVSKQMPQIRLTVSLRRRGFEFWNEHGGSEKAGPPLPFATLRVASG